MDTHSPFEAGSNYAGLKNELEKIAAIIEKYPDQLKQRAFELLINAYLGHNNTAEVPAAVAAPEAPVEETVSAEEIPAQETETPVDAENAVRTETPADAGTPEEHSPLDPYASRLESDSALGTADDTAANLLRKRIRLRSMSPVRWQTQSPV